MKQSCGNRRRRSSELKARGTRLAASSGPDSLSGPKAAQLLSATASQQTDTIIGSPVRPGVSLNFSLLQGECEVFCYIDLGSGRDDVTKDVFRALEAQKDEIEAHFGGSLVWEVLEKRRACRILKGVDGGWKAPEAGWPALQDRLIETMERFEAAIRKPIENLDI